MPSVTVSYSGVTQQATGLGNDSAWTLGGPIATVPFWQSDNSGNPAPPALAQRSNAGQGQNLIFTFDLSAVPSGAHVTSIVLTINRCQFYLNPGPSDGGTSAKDRSVLLRIVGVSTGADKASASAWPLTTPANATYTWTPGSGGVDPIAGSNLPLLDVLFDSMGTGGPAAIPFVNMGVPDTTITALSLTINYTVGGGGGGTGDPGGGNVSRMGANMRYLPGDNIRSI